MGRRMKFIYAIGATPYNEDEAHNLIPTNVLTQNEVNEHEQANILEAHKWLLTKKKIDPLSTDFMKTLHRKMFNLTWKWAGQFRQYQTNIGVAPYFIQESLFTLCADVRYWITEKTYTSNDIAVRFHHRIVKIHPFHNGNGRLSRLITDLLLKQFDEKPFQWNNLNLTIDSDIRTQYISALQRADREDYAPLTHFCTIDQETLR